MTDDSWMDVEADRLQRKADDLILEYHRLERRAAGKSGSDRHEVLDRLSEVTGRHDKLMSRIARLRGRVRI